MDNPANAPPSAPAAVIYTAADPSSHRVFLHIAAPKAGAYRAILRIFVAAKERFEIALRASEVAGRLAVLPAAPPDIAGESDVIACLDALSDWGI